MVFDSQGYLRITDFGIACLNNNNNSKETSGTPGYMSPEVLFSKNHSFLVDFYALGIISYELIYNDRPYHSITRKSLRDEILKKQAKIKFINLKKGFGIDCMNFINSLIQRKPEKRLGYKNGIIELKNHKFFKDFDWDKLLNKELIPSFIPKSSGNFDKTFCEENEQIGEQTENRYKNYMQNSRFITIFKNYTYIDEKEFDFININIDNNNNIIKKDKTKIKLILKNNVPTLKNLFSDDNNRNNSKIKIYNKLRIFNSTKNIKKNVIKLSRNKSDLFEEANKKKILKNFSSINLKNEKINNFHNIFNNNDNNIFNKKDSFKKLKLKSLSFTNLIFNNNSNSKKNIEEFSMENFNYKYNNNIDNKNLNNVNEAKNINLLKLFNNNNINKKIKLNKLPNIKRENMNKNLNNFLCKNINNKELFNTYKKNNINLNINENSINIIYKKK